MLKDQFFTNIVCLGMGSVETFRLYIDPMLELICSMGLDNN